MERFEDLMFLRFHFSLVSILGTHGLSQYCNNRFHFKVFLPELRFLSLQLLVFTPLEYGVIGISEEVAIERLGQENVEVYHVHWKPLKWAVIPEKKDSASLPYVKIVCDKKGFFEVVLFLMFFYDAIFFLR